MADGNPWQRGGAEWNDVQHGGSTYGPVPGLPGRINAHLRLSTSPDNNLPQLAAEVRT